MDTTVTPHRLLRHPNSGAVGAGVTGSPRHVLPEEANDIVSVSLLSTQLMAL